MPRRSLTAPPPAFLFFGAFGRDDDVLDATREQIIAAFGPLHSPGGTSPLWDFPDTSTYRDSMGPDLCRRFWVVAERWPQDGLAAVKRRTLLIEDAIRETFAADASVSRPVNVDPGLINDCRVILATTKDRAHRIYRGAGIFEEVSLYWQGGAWQTLPWTYDDFHRREYHDFFTPFRDAFLGRSSPDQS